MQFEQDCRLVPMPMKTMLVAVLSSPVSANNRLASTSCSTICPVERLRSKPILQATCTSEHRHRALPCTQHAQTNEYIAFDSKEGTGMQPTEAACKYFSHLSLALMERVSVLDGDTGKLYKLKELACFEAG